MSNVGSGAHASASGQALRLVNANSRLGAARIPHSPEEDEWTVMLSQAKAQSECSEEQEWAAQLERVRAAQAREEEDEWAAIAARARSQSSVQDEPSEDDEWAAIMQRARGERPVPAVIRSSILPVASPGSHALTRAPLAPRTPSNVSSTPARSSQPSAPRKVPHVTSLPPRRAEKSDAPKLHFTLPGERREEAKPEVAEAPLAKAPSAKKLTPVSKLPERKTQAPESKREIIVQDSLDSREALIHDEVSRIVSRTSMPPLARTSAPKPEAKPVVAKQNSASESGVRPARKSVELQKPASPLDAAKRELLRRGDTGRVSALPPVKSEARASLPPPAATTTPENKVSESQAKKDKDSSLVGLSLAVLAAPLAPIQKARSGRAAPPPPPIRATLMKSGAPVEIPKAAPKGVRLPPLRVPPPPPKGASAQSLLPKPARPPLVVPPPPPPSYMRGASPHVGQRVWNAVAAFAQRGGSRK